MLHEDDDYCYVDDAGEVIPPNAEASALVAAAFGDELQTCDTDEWYLVGMQECEQLKQELNRIVAEMEQQSSEIAEADETDDEGDEEDEAEDEMEPASMTREYSDNSSHDEDWVLEDLWKRRQIKNKGEASSYDDDGKRQHKQHEYLCKWKWYSEPTWEPREVLEEMGYVKELDAFDERRHPQRATKLSRHLKIRPSQATVLEALMGGDFLSKVVQKLTSCSMGLTAYAPVDNRELEKQFIKTWHTNSATHCPMILFHGTREANMQSIASKGLLVPGGGNGVRVEHGSAYGVGIYAAKNPAYSRSYSSDSTKMFVCLGLVGPKYTTVKEQGDICVFFDESLIVPLWLIEYSTASCGSYVRHCRYSFSALLKRKSGDPLPPGLAPPRSMQLPAESSKAAGYERRPLSKKMLKQLPRSIKDLYKEGTLRSK